MTIGASVPFRLAERLAEPAMLAPPKALPLAYVLGHILR